MNSNLDLSGFKDYDIRGVYPKSINADIVTAIAHAVVRKFNPKKVAVCRDMRVSGSELRDAFVDTFSMLGVDVTDVGLGGTETEYYIAGTYDFDLVLMISASHNPPEYNGVKLVKKGPIAVTSDSGLNEIKELIIKEGPLPNAPVKGKIELLDVMDGWRDKVLSLVDTSVLKPMSVVVDAGNGMAGKLVPAVFGKLPMLRLTPLFFELDGTFPNHIPNPLIEENTRDLKKKVLEMKADLGVAFDGDADRMFIMDDLGRMVSGTITTALLSRYILQKHPNELILYNAICGRIVPEIIEKFGGKSKRVRVGHSYIKTYMREHNAIFAGEHSGHYYLRDFYMAESGVLTALMAMSLLSAQQKKLSQLVDELDVYPASGEINFRVEDTTIILKALTAAFGKQAQSVDELDGFTFWYPTYWFNVRLSKTEPLMRLNVEADNKEILDKVTSELVGFLTSKGAVRK